MTIQQAFKVLLFSVFLFISQHGLANDTYKLEEFRQYYKKNWKPASKEQQKDADNSSKNPFENIRIGFFRLNLTTDDVYGDDRLETLNDFLFDEQDLRYMSNFFSNYVNIGNPHYRHVRIQRMLRLMFRIFTVNVATKTREIDRIRMNAMARRLFKQLFESPTIDGRANPLYNYFTITTAAIRPDYDNANDLFALIFLAFLSPHALSMERFELYFAQVHQHFTRNSYHQAVSNSLMSGNISEYHSPQGFANQLNAANLDSKTALLIALWAMGRASHFYIEVGRAWPKSLEELLQRYLQSGFLGMSYLFMAINDVSKILSMPAALESLESTEEFMLLILGIDVASLPVLVEDDRPDSHGAVVPDDNSGVSEGAVGGATEETRKCLSCTGPLNDKTQSENGTRSVVCSVCIESVKSLRVESARIVNQRPKAHKCKYKGCNYSADRADHLKKHKKTHLPAERRPNKRPKRKSCDQPPSNKNRKMIDKASPASQSSKE
ncbi:hypothetical protein [Endozoicomonas sp. 4G]|uniref:hypothetical protein n=1 Tax=Endozoicomonas sp. 4G TaxID=2872754 RepID=UPI00207897C4|nr:hypothetical protein [Endozoicomonas sp. 4G]